MRFFRLSFWAVVTMFASVFLFSGSSVSAVNVPNKLYSIVDATVNGSRSSYPQAATPYPATILPNVSNPNSAQVHNFSVSGNVPVPKTGISYTAKAVVTYDIYGASVSSALVQACTTNNYDGFSAVVSSEQGIIIGRSNTFSCNVVNDTRVVFTINTSVNLQNSVNITTFAYTIAATGGNPLAYCSNQPGAMIPFCGSNFNLTVNNVQLDFTISEDPNTALLGQIGNKLDTTNQKLDELNDTLTDTTAPPELDGIQPAGWLPAGPIDSLLGLPLQFLNGLSNGLSATCQPINLPLPFVNSNLTLPCMRPILTSMGFMVIWEVVGAGIGALILFKFFQWLYKWVDDTLTMRENNSGLWGGMG